MPQTSHNKSDDNNSIDGSVLQMFSAINGQYFSLRSEFADKLGEVKTDMATIVANVKSLKGHVDEISKQNNESNMTVEVGMIMEKCRHYDQNFERLNQQARDEWKWRMGILGGLVITILSVIGTAIATFLLMKMN